jgi:hypothetical protein
VIAREDVTRVLEEPPAAEPPGPPGRRPGPASPIGAVAVPPWHEGAGASVLAAVVPGPAGSGGRCGAVRGGCPRSGGRDLDLLAGDEADRLRVCRVGSAAGLPAWICRSCADRVMGGLAA